MTGRWLAAGAVVGAGVLPGVAQPPAATPPNLLRRADPPTAPRTGLFVAPEWPHHKAARPGVLCGVPDYPYAPPGTARPSVAVLSLVRVPAARLAGADPVPAGAVPQVYQMPVERVQLDHCFLSRVAVYLEPDGGFRVSFRADQNPVTAAPPPAAGVSDTGLAAPQTAQLRRNLFLVRVRGYAGYPPAASAVATAGPSRPAVWEHEVPPFWVQRGEPYSGFVAGRSEGVRRGFAYIDRVEVEFTYR